MGREARARHAARPTIGRNGQAIALPKDQYWQLRALSQAVPLAQIEAQAQAKRMIDAAVAAQSQYFEALGKEHGFDTSKHANYRFDDATCTLTELPRTS